MFSEQQLNVIKYCAEEVRRQGDGPINVYDMLNAWNWANNYMPQRAGNPQKKLQLPINLDFIAEIGKLVEPTENPNGFRTIRIFVGNGWSSIEKAQPEDIERLLTQLLNAYYDGRLDPNNYENAKTAEDVFYYLFEECHPFRDGNGRSGKAIYNYLCGTLDHPIWPPSFWGDISNP